MGLDMRNQKIVERDGKWKKNICPPSVISTGHGSYQCASLSPHSWTSHE